MMKRILKFLIISTFYYSRFFLFVRLYNYLLGKRLTILTFHIVTEESPSAHCGLPSISLSLANFASLLKFLTKHYTVISTAEYLELNKKRGKKRSHYLILSFDDAYNEVLNNALPVLKKYQLPAILFVPTGMINDGGIFWWDAAYGLLSDFWGQGQVSQYLNTQPDSEYSITLAEIASKSQDTRNQAIYGFLEKMQNTAEELRQKYVDHILFTYKEAELDKFPISTVLDWRGIKAIHDAGVEIGSHTKNHRFLSTISGEEAKEELLESKNQLETYLGHPVTAFAYPGGKYTKEVEELVEQSGYACAFGTEPGINKLFERRYNLKRVNIWDNKVIGSRGVFSAAHAAWTLFFRF